MGALRPEAEPGDPVALETPVVATGARPGAAGDKRELFTEETQTVLVFEKGAVIRLSAGVADGQLLFLTNKKNGKEIVTQVVRKRSFRPTSCYVDLEFTEPCPGFWGIEFPKSAPSAPGQVAAVNGEEDAVDPAKHAAPNLAEVERLKKEVSELQTQLKSLIATEQGAEPSAKTTSDDPREPDSNHGKEQRAEKILEQLLVQEAEQEKLHGPKRLVAYPQKTTSSVVKTAGRVATAAAFTAVVVAAGVAAYRFGLLDSWIKRPAGVGAFATHAPKPANSGSPQVKAAIASSAPNPSPNAVFSAPPIAAAAPQSDGFNVASKSREPAPTQLSSSKTPSIPSPPTTASSAANETPHRSKRNLRPSEQSLVGISSASATRRSAGDSASPAVETTSASASEDYVAAKLIRAVRPVSPPEALRNYITGNVSVDALVDATGHVKSVTVLSGPQKLHKTAVEQMKEYVYEPAKRNGKPVPSHVQVSLQYWYEP